MYASRTWPAALLLAFLAAGAAPAAPAEEDVFWHDVTLRLDGALPNAHARLSDHLLLFLGRDDAVTCRAHRVFMRRLKRGLTDGFGDHGWFHEGTFCGRFPTNGALALNRTGAAL